jgi:hypothetical protein
VECNLDVSILVDVLNAAIKALQGASDAAFNAFPNDVIFVGSS